MSLEHKLPLQNTLVARGCTYYILLTALLESCPIIGNFELLSALARHL